MKKYYSKIDLWFVIPVIIIFGSVILEMIFDGLWIGLCLVLVSLLFFISLFINTFYILTDNELIIKCGVLYTKVLKINSIKKISETNDLISSPALSVYRLEIRYDEFDSVLISPKEKYEFIEAIKKINPDIEFYLKTKHISS